MPKSQLGGILYIFPPGTLAFNLGPMSQKCSLRFSALIILSSIIDWVFDLEGKLAANLIN